jgi:hypothetical protein
VLPISTLPFFLSFFPVIAAVAGADWRQVRFDWVVAGARRPARGFAAASVAAASHYALRLAPPTAATKFGRRLSSALQRGVDASRTLLRWAAAAPPAAVQPATV